MLGQVVGDSDQADEAALADHRVVLPGPAGEFLRARRAAVGRLFGGSREREEFMRPQSGGVDDQRRESVARVLGGGHHADLLRGVRPSALPPGFERTHHRQALVLRQPPGHMDQHGLERLPVHVEGLLAEIAGAASEVVDGGLGGEVAQFEGVAGDPPCDLEQTVAVVGDGAHGCGPVRIAAGAEVDQTADHGFGLALGRSPAELGHGTSAAQLSPQPAGDGGVVDADAAVPEPALQLGGRGARVVQRPGVRGVPVEARHRVPGAPPRARLLPEARGLGGRVEGLAIARTRHEIRHPAGCESDGPAVAVMDRKRMDPMVRQAT